MTARLDPRIDGVPVAHVLLGDHYGAATYSHGERGCQQMSFPFYAPQGVRVRGWQRGRLCELYDGPECRWSGVVSEVDYEAGEVHAYGFGAQAAGITALDAFGNATATPSAAVDRWIGLDGLVAPLRRDGSVPTAAYTASADGVNSVATLLDGDADEAGVWWTVEADRAVRFVSHDKAVYQIVEPVNVGTADDDYASVLNVRYRSGASTYATIDVPDQDAIDIFGYREEPVDATSLGVISSGRAFGLGQGLLAKGRSRLGWTNPLELGRYQLLTMGGQPADLSLVKSHEIVRIHGIDDDLAYLFGRAYLEVTIGETTYTDGAETISLSPMGSVATDFAGIIAELAGKATA